MRLGIMLRHFDQHDGGVKVYTRELVRAMIRLNTRHEIVLLFRNRQRMSGCPLQSQVLDPPVRRPFFTSRDYTSAWKITPAGTGSEGSLLQSNGPSPGKKGRSVWDFTWIDFSYVEAVTLAANGHCVVLYRDHGERAMKTVAEKCASTARILFGVAGVLATILAPSSAQADQEKVVYTPERCSGGVMLWWVAWHLHPFPGSAFPKQHLMKSDTQNGLYTEYSGSPWTNLYDFCKGPLTIGRWFIFLDCATTAQPDPQSSLCHFYPPVKIPRITCTVSP